MIIDLHTHGISGFDTRSSDVEHILKIAETHGAIGVDQIVLTVYPAPIKVMRNNLETIQKAMRLQTSGQEKIDSRDKFGKLFKNEYYKPASIVGAYLEGPFLNPLMCGSLNAMVLIEPHEKNFDELVEGFEDIIRIITIAPELEGAERVIRKAIQKGIIPNMGHSNATFYEAEKGHKAGARGITHLFNAMRPYHHREPGIAGYGLLNKDIYVEIIADPFHLHPATIDLIFKTKKHERILIVSDSIKETPSQALTSEPDAIKDRHGRLIGGALPVTRAVKNLSARIDAEILEQCVSSNPMRYLSI